ncbi:hypothetical protein M0R04_13810 [Candidatus Dojkabacteria bacterium]|jgi:hypothetical protein|nr:hypothetical protein [Candidatus Dojkabacteria bacterium]
MEKNNMPYLTIEQTKELINKRPMGVEPQEILDGLTSRGYTIQGLNENQPSTEKTGGLQGVGTGIAKGALSTVKGLGQIGTKIGNVLLPKSLEIPDVYSEEALKAGAEKGQFLGKLLNEENLKAKGVAENIGKTGEQIAEFFIPAGVATKAKKAVDAVSTIGKVTKVAAKSAIGATELGGVSAIQSGGDLSETGISAGIGAISPILGAGIKALKPAVAPVLEFTSGVPKQAIKKAMTGSDAVKAGMKMTTEEVRSKAVQAYKGLDSELKSGFSKGLEELSKLSPRIKPARTATVGGTSVFSGVKGKFKKILEGAKESVPQAFRDLRISVKGNKLDFDKLNSSIVNASERKQIQQVWDTIRNQTDFSVKGVQDVASRINALSKYEKGIESVSSVAIGKMHNVYSKAIEKVYPELGKLRSNYSTASKMLNEIDDVVRAGDTDPTKIQTAINKMTSLFKEDKNTYLKVIDDLTKKSGVDISGMLAGTEFQRVLPDFIRGFGGGGAVSVGAAVLNPFLILLAPLFSPKAIGKVVTNAPKLGKAIEPAKKIITGAVSQIQQ